LYLYSNTNDGHEAHFVSMAEAGHSKTMYPFLFVSRVYNTIDQRILNMLKSNMWWRILLDNK